VLGVLGRRAIDLAVLFLALYAFVFVPIGRRTGLEHLRTILKTRAAHDAGRDVLDAGDRLRRRLLADDEEPVRTHGRAVVPHLPRHAGPSNAGLVSNTLDGPDASLEPQ
jgi:hypothetical protein